MALVIGILAAVVVVVIISRWWVEGLISASEFLILSAIYGGLAFGLFAISMYGGVGGVILVLIPLIGSVVWALYCNQKLGIKQYFKDKIRTYELAIQADPRNTAARSMMAEAYYELGDLDSAIAAMELTIQMNGSAMKETHKLRQWQSERELRDSKTVICQVCHSRNIWGAVRCRTCMQPLVYPAGNKWRPSDSIIKRWEYYVIGVIWLILAIIAFVTLTPGIAGIVIGCSTLGALGLILLSSSRL